MSETAVSSRAQAECARTRRPMICEDEVAKLVASYGSPMRCTFNIQADEYIRAYRWRKDLDRRAEVVFAIQDPLCRIWLHAKRHYPKHIFRLPSGGINWDEPVIDALHREIEEETDLDVAIESFTGLIEYRFVADDRVAHFASYVFLVRAGGQEPRPHPSENITEFRAVLPSQIAQAAAELRNLIGDRHGWGQWRALAHDLVYEHLSR
jgi:NAD+ diphosphatase